MSDPASIARRVRRWSVRGPEGPCTLEVYPTLRCNLNCTFCDATERHRPAMAELPAERQLALLDEAAALGVRRVFVLGGGEPLVAAHAPALLRRVKDLGMEGILSTNGTRLTPALAAQLVDTGWDEVHFSVDGATAPVHDHLRGVPGSFTRTVSAACGLRGRRDRAGAAVPRIALHFVLTRHNHRHLAGMVRLARAIGAFRVEFDALVAWRPEQRALAPTPAQEAEIPALAGEALALAEASGIGTTLHHFLDPASLHRNEDDAPGAATGPAGTRHGPPPDPHRPRAEDLGRAPCLRPFHYLVVASDGRVSPCCVLAGQGGSVAGQPLAAAWQDDPFLQEARRSFLAGRPLARCRECSANILAHERHVRSLLWPST